jgi:ferritin
MISEEMQQALNTQIQKELAASNFYLQMAYWLKTRGLKNFACYMAEQSCEERGHALKFCEYIDKQRALVALSDIPQPKLEWKSVAALAYDVLLREQEVTTAINELMNIAAVGKDYATCSFLQYFIDEQVEAENTALLIFKRFEAANEVWADLYAIDNEFDDIVGGK